jgi:iron complex outermembrane receptor protein
MTTTHTRLGWLPRIGAAGLWAACAWPHHAQAQSAKPDEGAFAIEEVKVTARRVQENLQDTPVSVTALTPEALEQKQIFRTDDLDQTTPNMVFDSSARLAGNSSAVVITIRGIGQTDPTPDVDPGVGLYIDDVYTGHGVGGSLDFRDIASVQVLRGPQGALFGRNTIGGAVLITTRDPGKEFGANAKVSLGTDNLRDVFVGVDLPINETLGTRVTFGKRTQDGYIDYPAFGVQIGDTNTYTATGKVRWTPFDSLEVKLMADFTEANENGAALTNVAINPTSAFPRTVSYAAGCPGMLPPPSRNAPSPSPVPQINDPRCANNFLLGGPYVNNGTQPLKSDLRNRGVGLNIRYDLNDALALKSISSYREIDWDGSRDADGTPFPILATDYTVSGSQWSQELQLLYTRTRLTGVAGIYYFRERSDDHLVVTFTPPGTAPNGTLNCDCNLVRNHSWAVFTNWVYNLTKALSASAGARYTSDTKGSIPDEYDFRNPNVKWLPVQLYEETFTKPTFSGSLSYRWSPEAMTYLSYSQGFKGGGWNSHFNRAIIPTDPHLFKEETAESFELGFKTDLLGKRLRLNGALFTTDYENMQFTYRIGVAPFLFNTGKATIYGGELELTWVPTDNWLVEGGVGHLHAKIDRVDPLVNAVTGVSTQNKLPFTPEWQVNMGLAYQIHVATGLLTPRVDVFYQSRTFFDEGNTAQIAQLDPVTLYGASVAYESAKRIWRVIAGGRNLGDKKYSQGGNPSYTTSSGYAEASYVRGREYYVSVAYDFHTH